MDSESQKQFENLHIISEDKYYIDWAKAIQQVRTGYLPELNFTEERPYLKDDFIKHLDNSYKCLDATLRVIKSQSESETALLKDNSDILKNFTVPALLLCGENVQSKEWNESKHIEISYQILKYLKAIFKCDTATSIFLYKYKENSEDRPDNSQILHLAIQELSPKLSKKCWKNFPAAQHCFSWILHQVTFPDVGAHLHSFLPFTLCFVDDWEAQNKLLGLTCLDHIVKESNATELKWYGRSELIIDAFKKLLFCREQEIVNILIPCWLCLLTKVEPCDNHAKISSWDLLMKELLYKIEMETNSDLKHTYIKHLKSLLEKLDIGCVRWMSSVLRVLSSCMEAPTLNGKEDYRIHGIQTLQLVLKLGEERIKYHAKTVYEMLIRLLYETSKALTNGSGESINKLHEECVITLKFCSKHASEEFIVLCDGMNKVKVNQHFDTVIKSIFDDLLPNQNSNNSDSLVLCMQKP